MTVRIFLNDIELMGSVILGFSTAEPGAIHERFKINCLFSSEDESYERFRELGHDWLMLRYEDRNEGQELIFERQAIITSMSMRPYLPPEQLFPIFEEDFPHVPVITRPHFVEMILSLECRPRAIIGQSLNKMDEKYPHKCFSPTCKKQLYFSHAFEQAHKEGFTEKQFKKIWKSNRVEFYCCDCYNEKQREVPNGWENHLAISLSQNNREHSTLSLDDLARDLERELEEL